MTAKTDLRVTKTLKAIRTAFEEMVLTMKPAEITVKELTERAGINRKTFYLHYTCIEDVYEKFICEVADGFAASLAGKAVRYGEGAFDMASINRVFFEYYANGGPVIERVICNPHYREYYNKISAINLQRTCDEFNPFSHLPQAEQNIVFTFLVRSSIEMFCRWVEDGKKIPLERVIEITSELLMNGQLGYAQKFIQTKEVTGNA